MRVHPEAQCEPWTNATFWCKKEYMWVKPSMTACQANYGIKATEEQQASKDVQYNQSIGQLISGHMASHGSISNLITTNTAQ
jgi:hypothetical protein